ncbi:MAG: ABC transporter permease [Planctomycetia bacterium]|nr:ABC transporter permease [Planctomycetia bacterium]
MTLLAIAKNGFLESIRQPVFVVLLVAGTLAMVLNVNLAAFTLEDDNKLLVDLGLSTLFVAGLLCAAFTSGSVLSREIENKTVVTVVSKPVPRAAVVVGKFLGVAAAIGLAYWALAAVFLLAVRHRVQSSVRIDDTFDLPVLLFSLLFGGIALMFAGLTNYLYRRPFASVFAVSYAAALTAALGLVWCVDRDWQFQNPLVEWDGQLMIALVLIFEAVVVLAAVAIAASTRLGQVAALMVCVAAFLTGLVSEYFLGTLLTGPGAESRAIGAVARAGLWAVYLAVPNLQFFWPADALTQGHEITLPYFGAVSLYAALMVGGVMSVAVLLFQQRDVG